MIVTVDMPKLNPTYLSDLRGRSNFPDQYKTQNRRHETHNKKRKEEEKKKRKTQ